MKKIVGLFLVILISSISVFAQDKGDGKRGKKGMDPTKRWEKMVADLKLDDKQAAEFQKINEEFQQKMKNDSEARKADREAMKAQREKHREQMLAMKNERNEEMKKIMTDEQYQQFLQKQEPRKDRRPNRDGMNKRDHKDRGHQGKARNK